MGKPYTRTCKYSEITGMRKTWTLDWTGLDWTRGLERGLKFARTGFWTDTQFDNDHFHIMCLGNLQDLEALKLE